MAQENIFQELHRKQCEWSKTQIDWALMKELGDHDNDVVIQGLTHFHSNLTMFWLYVDASKKAGGDFLNSCLVRFRKETPVDEPAAVTEIMKRVFGS